MSGLVKMLGGGCWNERVLICLLLIIEVGTQRRGLPGNKTPEIPPVALHSSLSESKILFWEHMRAANGSLIAEEES